MVPRWLLVAMAAVVVACAVGLVLVLALGRGSAPGDGSAATPADAGALTAYVQALRPPTVEGGRIVQEEMKPSIGEFTQGKLAAPAFTTMAHGWQAELRRVKTQIDQVTVPAVVADAGPLFDQAMDGYVAAAQLFEQAGRVATAERTAALDRAVAQATNADHVFDQASAVVQRALSRAGLPVDPNLPNPSPSASAG